MSEMPIILAMFDLDGTLADTSFLHKKLFRPVMKDLGYELTDDDLKPTLGKSMREGLDYLFREKFDTVLSEPRLDVFEATVIKRIKAQFIPELRKIPPDHLLMPGALETLEYLSRRADVIVCVVSNSTRANVDAVLDHLGISHLVQYSIVGEEALPKPSPAMILKIHERVEATGIKITRPLFFGDTTADRDAVIAARIHIPQLEFHPIIGATHCPPEARGEQAFPDGRKGEFKASAKTLKITDNCTAYADLTHLPHIVFHGSKLPVCIGKVFSMRSSIEARSQLAT